jgi:hypothetical protein
VCCRNPSLAVSRAVKRESLLAVTGTDLEKIRASVAAIRHYLAGRVEAHLLMPCSPHT